VLAVVRAVVNAGTPGTSAQGVLDGFHAALAVPLAGAVLGAPALLGLRRGAPVEPTAEETVQEAAQPG
jgi:hypothetical protein